MEKSRKNFLILASIIITTILMASIIIPVIANPVDLSKRKGQQFPPSFMNGERISVYVDGQSLPVDEPYYVCHGWLWQNCKEYSGEEKKSILKDYWFELEIDGEPVEMKKWMRKYVTLEVNSVIYEDAMLIVFYVQFDANHFESGTYNFRGVWNGSGGILQEFVEDVEFIE
jgi:hypothetical protein